MKREEKIKRSICRAVLSNETRDEARIVKGSSPIKALFALYDLDLRPYSPDSFADLRQTWHVELGSYLEAFRTPQDLQTKGSMGYSGSTFFTTKSGNYLIKSVPRRFEYTFFRDDLLQPYHEHMAENVDSLLIRITDFLAWKYTWSLGGVLGAAPTHHIIMENLLVGKDEAEKAARIAAAKRREHAERVGGWKTWDLKPMDYFFPERDVAGGKLASEATKSKLADKFNGKIVLRKKEADELIALLEKDTELLARTNAVDYSLFLVRIPLDHPQNEEQATKQQPDSDDAGTNKNPFEDPSDDTDGAETNAPDLPSHPPFTPPSPPSWRTGVRSADNKYVYRAAILDFFWAKHKAHAKFMTALVKAYNFFDRQGPMSITTSPDEYRERFLHMCRSFLKLRSDETEGGTDVEVSGQTSK